LEIVIEVVKLIGKSDFSYRASQHQSSNSLQNPILDHGNFLEIIFLMKKYNVILNEHADKMIKNTQVKATCYQSTKVKGLTFISKTTVNLVIDVLKKRPISSEVQEAEMYRYHTYISVQDQCTVILRYVNIKRVNEKLISVVIMKDSKVIIFHEMLQVLVKNGLDIKNV